MSRVLLTVSDWATARPPLVVFDLDATLYDTRPRTLEILRDLSEDASTEDPDLSAALRGLTADGVDYLLTDTLRSCGIVRADAVNWASTYWRERFYADEWIQFDLPTPGAVDYVRACHDAGAVVLYLTGRDLPGMLAGTVTKLRDDGFPVGVVGTELVLKPDAGMGDEAFKRGALPTLERVGDVVAVFDNEPANCNLALDLYPAATVVLVDTQRVPGAPEPFRGIEAVADFRIER